MTDPTVPQQPNPSPGAPQGPPPGPLPSYPTYPTDGGAPQAPWREVAPGEPAPYASWIERVGALVLDAIPSIVISFIATAVVGSYLQTTTDPATGDDTLHFHGGRLVVIVLIDLVWPVINWIILQGRTGQSIGKKVLGIAVHRAHTTEPIGYGLAIGRFFARWLDEIPCYLGLLWPLWDAENRTFADMICSTRVYKVQRS